MEQVLGLVRGGQSGDGGKFSSFLFFFDVFFLMSLCHCRRFLAVLTGDVEAGR